MKRSNRKQETVDRAIRRTLNSLQTIEGADALSEGESYVCNWCIQPVKPCETDASYQCKDKILGETQLNGLIAKAHAVSNGIPAVCPVCGKTIQGTKKNVLRELCPSCQARSSRAKRRKMKKEDSDDT